MISTLVSTKYQIVIPKKVRQKAKIKPGLKLYAYSDGEKIVLTPEKKWPDDYLKELKGVWKPSEIKNFIEEERNSWE